MSDRSGSRNAAGSRPSARRVIGIILKAALAVLMLAYIIWPFDVLADAFVGIGQIDDLIALITMILSVLSSVRDIRNGSSAKLEARADSVFGPFNDGTGS